MKRTVEVDGSMVCIQMVNPNIALLSEFIETTKNLLNKEGFTKIDINLPFFVDMMDRKIPTFAPEDKKIIASFFQLVCDLISRSKKTLTYLRLNLNFWNQTLFTEWNDSHTKELYESLCDLDNLTYFELDLLRLGFQTDLITQQSVDYLFDIFKTLGSKNIQTLILDYGSFGSIQTYALKGFYCFKHMQSICGYLEKNSDTLQHLAINMRSWGYENVKIDDDGMMLFGSTLIKLIQLKHLDINFYCCQYNKAATQKAFEPLFQGLGALQNLRELKFGLDWCRITKASLIKMFDGILQMKHLESLSLSFTQTTFSAPLSELFCDLMHMISNQFCRFLYRIFRNHNMRTLSINYHEYAGNFAQLQKKIVSLIEQRQKARWSKILQISTMNKNLTNQFRAEIIQFIHELYLK